MKTEETLGFDFLLGEIMTALYTKGDEVADEIEWFDEVEELGDVYNVRCQLDSIITTARHLRSLVDKEIGNRLDGGSVRFHDKVLKYGPGRVTKVIDPETLWDFLGEDARHCFNPDYVRITSLKAVAKKRGRDPRVIVDSLLFHEEGEPTLSVIPVTRATKWQQALGEGEIGRYQKASKS